MLRVSKLTDYGTIIMGELAKAPGELRSASELAQATALAPPTVSKVLKRLSRSRLVVAERGCGGGYRLARDPAHISVAQIVRALEGPVALTECSLTDGHCLQEHGCNVRSSWQRISRVVVETLERMSLAELAAPLPAARGASDATQTPRVLSRSSIG